MNFLDYLRSKPETTKKIIIYATAAILGIILLGVWLSTIEKRLSQISIPPDERYGYPEKFPQIINLPNFNPNLQ